MKLNQITEAGLSRRQFLRTTGGAAVAASTGNTSGALSSIIGATGISEIPDIFQNISDEKLMSTPEEKWITKVPYARLLRIINNSIAKNPDSQSGYSSNEIICKLTKVVSYGASYRQSGPIAKILIQAIKDSGNSKALPGIAKGLIDNMADYSMDVLVPDAGTKQELLIKVQEAANKVVQSAKDVGLDVPAGYANNKFRMATVENLGDTNGKTESQNEQPEEYDIPADYYYANSMHQPFESKLNKILATIC